MKNDYEWFIYGPSGNRVRRTNAATRSDSIQSVRDFSIRSWREMYREGYRCVKCEVIVERCRRRT